MPEERSLLLVRHAEAFKTLQGVHGGSGTDLTEQGHADIFQLAKFVLDQELLPRGSVIYSSFVPQVRQTAELLAELSGAGVTLDERLRNLHMGVLAGLPDKEAYQRHPEVMARLAAWREGRLPIEALNIPDAEPLAMFLQRIRSVLGDGFARSRRSAWIVTRSVGIAIINVMLANGPLKGQPYTRFRLDPCSASLITADSIGDGELVYVNRSEFLCRTTQYADD